MNRLPSIALAALCALPLPALAARDFTPQAGTWVISSELDGKPGRGLAIDVQGNTLFMQVFNYGQNGDATFHTALGQMDGNAVTAPLVRYRGGRSFGSEARDAVEDGSPGNVTVSFANGLQGTVQFPGEEPVAIQRFAMPDMDNDLPRIFDYRSPLTPTAKIEQQRLQRWYLLDAAGNPAGEWMAAIERWWPNAQAWASFGLMATPNGDDIELRLTGKMLKPGAPQYPETTQIMRCTPRANEALECTAKLDIPLAKGQQHVFGKVVFRRVGADVHGLAYTLPDETTPAREFRIGGMNIYQDARLLSNGYYQHFQYHLIFKRPGACITPCPIPTTSSMPGNGTWVVADELTGKPGRGIGLDVQDTTVIAQVFNYLPGGQPTFHMGSATNYLQSRADLALKRYEGGRWFGGPAQSAHEAENAGVLRLAPDPADRPLSPLIQFPGETLKPMQRLMLEGGSWQERMLGIWLFNWLGTAPDAPRFANLTRIGENFVSNDDGSVQCWSITSEAARLIQCRWYREPSVVAATVPAMHADNLPFPQIMQAIRVSDRHGNLVGLGNIPLP